jgi:hypothetical protein
MNNPPAFPLHNHGVQTLGMHISGMTLRDYFAAKAMQATVDAWIQRSIYPPTDDEVAKNAYAIADAMLKAREA